MAKTLRDRLDEAIENGEITDSEARHIFRDDESEKELDQWE